MSCLQQIQAFGILVPPGFQITAFLPPGGMSCSILSRAALNDFLRCDGIVPANTRVTGNIRTSPPPTAGMVNKFYAVPQGGQNELPVGEKPS